MKLFISLFLFRYIRVFGTALAYYLSKPIPSPRNPRYTSKDVTVIIPTVDPHNPYFSETLHSILANNPSNIIIVTVGSTNLTSLKKICSPISDKILCLQVDKPSKRKQIIHGIQQCSTAITILCDDHVFWPPTFLVGILAPFNSPRIGAVGSTRRVRRFPHPLFSVSDFFNYLGAIHFARRNMDILSTNTIDGGVYCLPGSTVTLRTDILKDDEFQKSYLAEYCCLGRFGPMNVDDDCFTTRWLLRKGWEVKMQQGEAVESETTLGEYPKYMKQCLRWARTWWRTEVASLRDGDLWSGRYWSAYATHLYYFVQFGLIYDGVMAWALWEWVGGVESRGMVMAGFMMWMLVMRLVKLVPYHVRRPRDMVYIPGAIAFAYVHSFVKLYALVTFWDIGWGGRKLDEGEEGEKRKAM